ncbi:lanthionine synthetase LanC family protein [Mucilaginibacter sabulilitoris]|uniref:non-specific serine/threonine protein kinase n=1 Tax=Mucilaginibacter sabulilitoris TaxID=1173583 RepID=A0ABZ0TRW3_9SPHI|nr:lanthionine synthetase LanC family protein [Mucilaginibacter sabulilitoris]WPU95649.1 lanthionine synthetase LanC family protein [Mucilaginibacter sabulilitoris]
MEHASVKENGSAAEPLHTAINTSGKSEPGYSIYLREQNISFSHIPPYLLVGSANDIEGWLIHISIIRQQFDSAIRSILEFLKTERLSFAIPADAEQHNDILGGATCFHLTAKVISIYLNPDDDLAGLFNKLENLTKEVIGPSMPCAYHLTSVIAVGLGSLFEDINSGQTTKSIFYGSAIADAIIEVLKANRLSWPFQHIRPLKACKESRLLNRQYIPIETLKRDPKGNVVKALKINSIYNMQWCIVKQGRYYQSFDNCGRDATDRLKWQYRIHQQFAGMGILPKPIAYFELYGDGFFAMEYKESISLTQIAAQLSEGRTWRSMPVENKRMMINYLLQVARILEIFHQEGFVHRDVTAANFIVTEAGQVFAIDIELCYDLRNGAPEPHFTLGTPGYMSPEQAAGESPSKKDDIYSFGALLIFVFTGVLPNKLNHRNTRLLEVNLARFIESRTMISMIVSCLDRDPECRSSLKDISLTLELYDTILKTNQPAGAIQFSATKSASLENVLFDGAKTLSTLIPTLGVAELTILVLLNRYASSQGGDRSLVEGIVARLKYPDVIEMSELDLLLFAVELSQIKSDSSKLMLDFVSKAVPSADDDRLNTASISNGLAGKGLKLLYLMDNPAVMPDPLQLADVISRISALQHKDGSWTTAPGSPNGKRYQVTGFSHGVAGVTYFLLSCYTKYGSEELKIRIHAALIWLTKKRRSENNRQTWSVSAENKTIDPWLEHGFSGVALSFIKAYEVLGDPEYKKIASDVLSFHPPHITSNYCSFGNGLAGLGEIYLEAFRVFGDQEWYNRASAIEAVLLNSCYRDENLCYWLDGTQLEPTADFWSGNAGVLHFLLRFSHPHEIPFPYHLIK